MSLLEIARRHYRTRQRLIRALRDVALSWWRQVDITNLDLWYRQQGPRLLVLLAASQLAVARIADAYLDAVLAAQGIDSDPMGLVNPSLLSGVASDGRDLDGLLKSPIYAVKEAIRDGHSNSAALGVGWADLDMIVSTQVADAGRVADGVALAARPQATGYVRMVNPPTCPRCAILAGQFYKWSSGFLRHPRCDCVHIPSREHIAGDLLTDPDALFRAGLIRGLTKAETQAIEDGADMARVVNVKRSGIYTADGRRFTREAARRRPRPTPEQIYRDATSREDAIRLLRRHGYLR